MQVEVWISFHPSTELGSARVYFEFSRFLQVKQVEADVLTQTLSCWAVLLRLYTAFRKEAAIDLKESELDFSVTLW